MKMSQEEAFVEKRFKKDGYKVTKLDNQNKYKAPDFKIKQSLFEALVEVKIGFKKGKIIQRLENGAFQYDPDQAIFDYFRNVSNKRDEYLRFFPKDKVLSYLLVFISPFFIENSLVWNEDPYIKYPCISAILIPKRFHPFDEKAESMTTEELEELINSTSVPFNSKTQLGWKVIKNPFAANSFDLCEIKSRYIESRVLVKHPKSYKNK